MSRRCWHVKIISLGIMRMLGLELIHIHIHNVFYHINNTYINIYTRPRETRELARVLRISLLGIVTQFLRAFTTQLEEMQGFPEDGHALISDRIDQDEACPNLSPYRLCRCFRSFQHCLCK